MEISLKQSILTVFGVNASELEQMLVFFKPMELKKGDFFLKSGQYAQLMGFLQSGLLREYIEVEDKEVTKWISTPGYFIVDLSSYLFESPARWNIQALSDCKLLVINKSDYQQMGRQISKWPILEKLFIARCFTVLEDRVLAHLSLDAAARYARFFAYNPDLFNQAPLQYLASMLGMTPETFSRIRKKHAQGNS